MNKKRLSVGYVYLYNYFLDDYIIKALEKKLNVIKIPFKEETDFDELKQLTKNCKVVVNYSVSADNVMESLEISKALEELGKKVINSSHSFLYQEDKWMLYLKCLEHKIPTARTFLVARGTRRGSKFIKDFLKSHKVVLKAVYSDCGRCVERVDNYSSFIAKLHKIVKKNPISPIIAQEFIPNDSRGYRVTVINNKVIQAVVKIGTRWKTTGDSDAEHYRTIKLTKSEKEMCEKTSKILGMGICGLDLVRNNGKLYIIEANSCPGLNWIDKDFPRLIESIANYIYSVCKKYS